jgi:nucleoside 2-deoxyribosyltransferase
MEVKMKPAMVTSLYVASAYRRRDELRKYAAELQSFGVRVTSRWLSEDLSLNVKLSDVTDDFSRNVAVVDLEDILAADGMLFFAEDANNQPPRGGRHVEFGYALAEGLQMYVVGDRENIFHYLPNVHHFATFNDFTKEMLNIDHTQIGG